MIRHDIEQLIKPQVEGLGYVLWGCEYSAQGKHSLLRIYIDQKEGINLEDCERVSRNISNFLDEHDPIHGHYNLEVSSPGIPRPLFQGWQYKLYINQEVNIKLQRAIKGKRKFTGVILSVNDDTLVLNLGDVHQEFLFSNIVKANLT